MFNRNKKEHRHRFAQAADGAAVARKLAAGADVVLENFKPGTMAKYGLDYDCAGQGQRRASFTSATRGFCLARMNTAPRSMKSCR